MPAPLTALPAHSSPARPRLLRANTVRLAEAVDTVTCGAAMFPTIYCTRWDARELGIEPEQILRRLSASSDPTHLRHVIACALVAGERVGLGRADDGLSIEETVEALHALDLATADLVVARREVIAQIRHEGITAETRARLVVLAAVDVIFR